MEPTEAEIAWAAGLFEGEGSMSVEKSGRVRLSLKMTDQDCVARFCEVVGGRVYGPYNTAERPHAAQDPHPRKPWFLWHSDAGADWRRILRAFWPWLHARRRARAVELGFDTDQT